MSVENSHNINNWHWTEKSFAEWAIPRMKELLTFESKQDTFELKVTADTVKGDVFKYVRKNKVHPSYDLECKLNFEYSSPGCDIIEGSITVNPFVDEPMDDWEFEVKFSDKKKATADLLARARADVNRSLIYPRVQVFLDEFEKIE